MNKSYLRMAFWIFLMIATSTIAREFTANYVALASPASEERNEVPATVEKIESDLAFFKTETGATRTVSVKKIKEEKIRSLKPGDQVILKVDQGDQIVDVDKKKK